MQSLAKATGTLRMAAIALATGASDNSGTRLPLGRSKCEMTTTFAPFFDSSRMVSAVRSMRVASVTLPSRIGTFRSARTSTRLPETARSSIVAKLRWGLDTGLAQLRHRLRRIDHAAGKAPLVVVPGHHAAEVLADGARLQQVDRRGPRRVVVIGRHQRLVR